MGGVRSKTFTWRFDAPAAAIWPALADTARFNAAAGLPRHAITTVPQPNGSVRYYGAARKGPFRLAWEELPAEWVDSAWFRHVRVFSVGPFAQLSACLRLEPDGTCGCIGRYTLEVSPRTRFGALLLRSGFFPAVERSFTRLAETALAWAKGLRTQPFDTAPFDPGDRHRPRIAAAVARIEASGNGHGLAARLAAWLLAAQQLDVIRFRPLALAAAWGIEGRLVVELCLQAAREGLLDLQWDLLCPRCRGAKIAVAALDRLPAAAHCETCNIRYGRDFDRNVELTFRPAAWLRPLSEGEFCLFGPMTTPHVKVQIAVPPGGSRLVPTALEPGAYRLRTVEIGGETDLDWSGGGFPEAIAEAGTVRAGPPAAPGMVRLTNREDRPRLLVVESRRWVRDALTAHAATTLQAFRDLFPEAGLKPGEEAPIANIALMFTDLKGSTALYERIGDVSACGLVRRHFGFLTEQVRRHRGAVIKTIGDAVMAAFAEPADAVRAALAIQRAVGGFNRAGGGPPITLKLGLHAGPCVAVTLNDRLDYFGSTVNMAARLQNESGGGDIVLSNSLARDPGVADLLRPLRVHEETGLIRGFAAPVSFHRVQPLDSDRDSQ